MTGPSARQIHFLETLGRGGFGAVYLADVHRSDDFVQRVAVKVLSTEMTADPDIAARQRDEARLLARLNHDHIVKVYDLTQIHGRPAVLMEYVEGVDAGRLLRSGPLPPRAALQVAAAASSALHAAWSTPGPQTGRPLHVIHRDIKPDNLLISRHGGVKVLDFGVARAEFEREGHTSQVQFGTARFMAPEQWLYGEVSHGVDIYALGVSLVEMLAGAHLNRPPLAPDAFAQHVDAVCAHLRPQGASAEWLAELHHLVRDLLAFEPTARPTAGEVHERTLQLADSAPGESLGRLARREVPPLIELRREKYADATMLEDVSLSQPGIAVAGSGPEGGARGGESDTLAHLVRGRETSTWPAYVALSAVAGLISVALIAGLAVWWATRAVPIEQGDPTLADAPHTPAQPSSAAVDDLIGEADEALEEEALEEEALEEEPLEEEPLEDEAGAEELTVPPVSPAATPRSARPSAPTRAEATRPAEPEAVSEPEPAAAEPAATAAAAPALPTTAVTIASLPMGARFSVDGAAQRTAPSRVNLTHGSHRVAFEGGGRSGECTVRVSRWTRTILWDADTATCTDKS